ncbi:MAG: alpha/beta hydrolase [Anaerolineae bacterium]|nr:alpha/beta hydrolase [Anaerolineae bacterium]
MYKTILRTCLIFGLLTLTSLVAFAQDTPLVPFSDDTYGIQGLIPDGWQSQNDTTIYTRQSTPTDLATLILQSAPLSIDRLWPLLLPQLGLDEIPESVGTYTTDALEWSLYNFDYTQGDITVEFDLGLAELNGTTYLALLQAAPEEYDTLHESVFLPVLDALQLLEDEDVPYLVEDVTFDNGDVTLAGTLTLPDTDGQHPAVVLMTGSGQQNRDEMVVPGFPIFKLIADHLTRNGIAVLRYDDRGVGQSGGDYNASSIYDFAADGEAAIAYLKTRDDINPDQVGVLGHSEGGVDASIIGANPDSGAAFIISMAGTAVDGQAVLLRQNELIMQSGDATDAQIQSQLDFLNSIFAPVAERDWETVGDLVHQHVIAQWDMLTDEERAATGAADAEAFAQREMDSFLQGYATESFATFLEYNPGAGWAQTTVPVLGIFGSLDLQVDAEQNAGPMEAALSEAGNEDFTVVTIEGANHLFQAAETGSVAEYISLPKEFTAEFLPTVTDWLLAHVDVN